MIRLLMQHPPHITDPLAKKRIMAESKYNDKFLKQAHKECIYHENKILKSKLCGCFYCKETFESKKILEWTDEGSKKEKTAMCPNCGIDSVLNDEFPIDDKEFLNQMNKLWFQV